MTAYLETKIQSLLKVRVKLDNGEEASMVGLDPTGYHPIGRFYCNLCCANIGAASNLLSHCKGRSHTKLMARNVHPAAAFGKSKNVAPAHASSSPVVTKLSPGEPVPPGFEDEVKRVPEISGLLAQMKSPLLGLEFLAEVTAEETGQEPRYLCMLCDKKGDKNTVLAHLVCFNHRIRYLQLFFPRTIAALEGIPKLKEYRRGTGEVLARITRAIENKFGRMEPVIIEELDFEKKKADLFQTMMKGPHFTETPQCYFENQVDMNYIKNISVSPMTRLAIDEEVDEAKRLSAITRIKLAPPSVEKSVEKNNVNENPEPAKPDFKANKEVTKEPESANNGPPAAKKRRQPSVSPVSSFSSGSRSWSRSRSRSRSRDRRDRHRRQPPLRRTRSRSRSRSPGRWKRRNSPPRRRSIGRRSPPRRSPMRGSPYRRPPPAKSWAPVRPVVSFKIKPTPALDKEIEEEKERKAKIRQLKTYSKALKDEMALKEKTFEKTPEKHPMYSEEWKKFWNKRYKELTAEGKDASKHDFKPEWIEFWNVRIKELNDAESKTRLKAFRVELGLPDDVEDSEDDVIALSPSPAEIAVAKKRGKSDLFKEEEEVNVIHVLRTLTALEGQLGSLGPRVNALLSHALALERGSKGASDRLLDNPENLVLFETVKEKLKGQLFSGVVERYMVRGTKRAITKVVDMFLLREDKQAAVEAAAAVAVVPPPEPLIVPGVGLVDKMAIAQQIASTLIAQGRTDLSEDDLEQLINAVVGMAQVSHAVAQAAKEEEPPVESKSSLQDLLSSVVKAHSAKAPAPAPAQASSLQLIQSYDDPPAAKGLSMKEMSQLSDHDLKTLLQNFKGLSRGEQQFLIAYLKELEAKDAANVTKLRSFINLDESPSVMAKSPSVVATEPSGRLSPFSSREGGANPSSDKPQKTTFEDDDDDYAYEEIFKAKKNAKKVSGKDVVQKMMEDQEKKVADAKASAPKVALKPSTTSKPTVVIDPNTLFNGNDPATPVTTEQASFAYNSPSTIPTMAPIDAAPETTTADSAAIATALPATALGPAMTVINPAPQSMAEPPPGPTWDGFSYPEQQGYAYPPTETYNYSTEPTVEYLPQNYQNSWTDQGYQQQQHDPYASVERYNYPPQNFDVPPPGTYGQPNHYQGQGYY